MNGVFGVWLVGLFGCGSTEAVDTGSEAVNLGASADPDFSDAEGGCPDSWVLTYGIEGRVDITHTPLNIGNAEAFVGGLPTDEIVIRVPNEGGVPAAGAARMISFDLIQDFDVAVNLLGEIGLDTRLHLTAADECGLANGRLQGSNVVWGECDFGSDHGSNDWDPDDGASGSGCMNDFRVEGSVQCTDDSVLASCEDGWLNEGNNALNYAYNQPLLDLRFDSPDLEGFTMEGSDYGTEVPTFTNNRTWLSLDGELKSMSLEPTPDCLCGD